MKDLRAKNVYLAKQLKVTLHYRDAVREAEAKTTKTERKRIEEKGQLGRANFDVEKLRKELYEIESQVVALTRRLDHASEYHCLATKALEALTKRRLS